MKNELSNKITRALHELFREHKNNVKFFLRGEDAILLYLYESLKCDVVTPSDISENLNITSARVAATLNSLQSKGFITREIDEEDRRKIIIKLTKEGEDVAKCLRNKHFDELNHILTKLGEDDTNELLRIIKDITKILKEEKNYA